MSCLVCSFLLVVINEQQSSKVADRETKDGEQSCNMYREHRATTIKYINYWFLAFYRSFLLLLH